jgi:hypothetical protein
MERGNLRGLNYKLKEISYTKILNQLSRKGSKTFQNVKKHHNIIKIKKLSVYYK